MKYCYHKFCLINIIVKQSKFILVQRNIDGFSAPWHVLSDVAAHAIALYKDGVLFSLPSSRKVCFQNELEGLRDYIGNGVEGNSDGKTLKCKFYQPTGLCVEFDDEVYVVDYRTSCVKVFSSTRHTTEFLAATGNLMRAFAIHDKKRSV